MNEFADFALTRVALSTGFALDCVDIGPRDAPVLIFLHGFPESHRTWRHQLGHFAHDFRVIAPDSRGYCRSDKPEGVENYTADKLADDVFALADALGVDRFNLVGHDWGGAIAWLVALRGAERVERLVILNAPHPLLFQRAVFDDPEQRAASQYVRAFRDPANDTLIAKRGLIGLLLKEMHWDRSPALSDAERARMMIDWAEPGAAMTMLNWYRASQLIVPAIDEEPVRPAWLDARFPKITVPTLVIWATDDRALRPGQLDGLDALVDDLTVVKVPDCGHFVPWEAHETVNVAMADWLGRRVNPHPATPSKNRVHEH